MISLPPGTKVFLACRPVDLRNGFDGLAAKAQQMVGGDPFSSHLFLFRGKRGDYLKALYWDGSRFWLLAKRLEQGRFVWPPVVDGTMTLTWGRRTICPKSHANDPFEIPLPFGCVLKRGLKGKSPGSSVPGDFFRKRGFVHSPDKTDFSSWRAILNKSCGDHSICRCRSLVPSILWTAVMWISPACMRCIRLAPSS